MVQQVKVGIIFSLKCARRCERRECNGHTRLFSTCLHRKTMGNQRTAPVLFSVLFIYYYSILISFNFYVEFYFINFQPIILVLQLELILFHLVKFNIFAFVIFFLNIYFYLSLIQLYFGFSTV